MNRINNYCFVNLMIIFSILFRTTFAIIYLFNNTNTMLEQYGEFEIKEFNTFIKKYSFNIYLFSKNDGLILYQQFEENYLMIFIKNNLLQFHSFMNEKGFISLIDGTNKQHKNNSMFGISTHKWYHVQLEYNEQIFIFKVDGNKKEYKYHNNYETNSQNILERYKQEQDKMRYIGSLPFRYRYYSPSEIRIPSALYLSSFIGLIENVLESRFENGLYRWRKWEEKYLKNIQTYPQPNACINDTYCENYGICVNKFSKNYNSLLERPRPSCQCDKYHYTGDQCRTRKNGEILSSRNINGLLIKERFLTFHQNHTLTYQRLIIEFRTIEQDIIFYETRLSPSSSSVSFGFVKFSVELIKSQLALSWYNENGKKNIHRISTSHLNDNYWHKVKMRKHYNKLYLYIDGNLELEKDSLTDNQSFLYLGDCILLRKEIPVITGTCLRTLRYEGELGNKDFLQLIQSDDYPDSKEYKFSYFCEYPTHILPLQFSEDKSYLRIPIKKFGLSKTFSEIIIKFTFRTLKPNSLMLFMELRQFNLTIEIFNGFPILFIQSSYLRSPHALYLFHSHQKPLNDGSEHRIFMNISQHSFIWSIDHHPSNRQLIHLVHFNHNRFRRIIFGMKEKESSYVLERYGTFDGCLSHVQIQKRSIDLFEIMKNDISNSNHLQTFCSPDKKTNEKSFSENKKVIGKDDEDKKLLGIQFMLMNIQMFTRKHVLYSNNNLIRKKMRKQNECSHQFQCQNFGNCHIRWDGYFCDCTQTPFTGHTCEQPTLIINLKKGDGMKFEITNLKYVLNIVINFFTKLHRPQTLLQIVSKSGTLIVQLERNQVMLIFLKNNPESQRRIFYFGKALLLNGLWQRIELKFLNRYLHAQLNNENIVKCLINHTLLFQISTIVLGGEFQEKKFQGKIRNFFINSIDFLNGYHLNPYVVERVIVNATFEQRSIMEEKDIISFRKDRRTLNDLEGTDLSIVKVPFGNYLFTPLTHLYYTFRLKSGRRLNNNECEVIFLHLTSTDKFLFILLCSNNQLLIITKIKNELISLKTHNKLLRKTSERRMEEVFLFNKWISISIKWNWEGHIRLMMDGHEYDTYDFPLSKSNDTQTKVNSISTLDNRVSAILYNKFKRNKIIKYFPQLFFGNVLTRYLRTSLKLNYFFSQFQLYQFTGCITSFYINGYSITSKNFISNYIIDEHCSLTPIKLITICHNCHHGGKCVNGNCDCIMTTFEGKDCSELSIGFTFNENHDVRTTKHLNGYISYNFTDLPSNFELNYQPYWWKPLNGIVTHLISFGIVTFQTNTAVILQMIDKNSNEFLFIQMRSGYLILTYGIVRLKNGHHVLSHTCQIFYQDQKINDGIYHVVRAEITMEKCRMQIDNKEIFIENNYFSANNYSTAQPKTRYLIVGMEIIRLLHKTDNHQESMNHYFQGKLFGFIWNSLRLVDQLYIINMSFLFGLSLCNLVIVLFMYNITAICALFIH
ncbi:hypothetical protein SNEBB_000708 [Seison nebaliae]|nr:hypothetical protein SNEBB_000708 [Seison nebaliae]